LTAIDFTRGFGRSKEFAWLLRWSSIYQPNLVLTVPKRSDEVVMLVS